MLLFTTLALAWEPAATIERGGSYQGGAIRPGVNQIAVATFDTLTLRDPNTDAVLASHPRGGGPLAWMPDGSGIVHCAIGGLFLVPVHGDSFGTEVQLAPFSCFEAIPRANDVVILANAVFEVSAQGTMTPTGLMGDLLAVRGDDLLVADFGASTGSTLDGSIVDFGIPVRQIAASDDRWFASDQSTIVFVEDGEPVITLPFTGGISGTGDLDGDGLPDAVGYNDDGSWVYESLSSSLRMLPGVDFGSRPSFVPTVDDCATVLGIDPGYRWTPPFACHGDADGDGSTTEQGDCDDSDAARGPNVIEICDLVDDDCDGSILDVPLMGGTIDATEGSDAYFEPGICQDLASHLDVDAPCFTSSETVICEAIDDASYTVELRFGDQMVDIDVTIRNFVPEFTGNISLTNRQLSTFQIEIYDLGVLDTHRFELLDGPKWVELSADGILTVDAPKKNGEHELRMVVTDDDGGRTEDTLFLTIRDPTAAVRTGEGCSCSLSGVAPVGMIGWFSLLMVRRRRARLGA